MFSLFTSGHSVTRRELLTAGGLTALGLTSGALTRLRASSPTEKRRANSCVFLFLFGGPSQIDLWDMKPQAPDNVRGDFTPTKTVVPGIHLCEHLSGLWRDCFSWHVERYSRAAIARLHDCRSRNRTLIVSKETHQCDGTPDLRTPFDSPSPSCCCTRHRLAQETRGWCSR